MRRLATIALLILMLSTNSITFIHLVSGQQNNLLYDNFEGYSEGSFPSAGGWEIVWDGRGGGYQQVVVWSGSKRFQVWGSPGWSAVIQRSFSSQARYIGYEFDILIDGRGTSGVDHPGFFCRECATWGVYWATVEFDHSSGQIRSGSTILGTWEPNRFYHIKVILDRDTETYNVWIDGELRAENLPARAGNKPPTMQIRAIALVSQWSGHRVLYDNVRIFESTQEGNYYLRVYFSSAVVNGVSLSASNPTITVSPGSRISGYLEVTVDNNRGGAWITPVIGTASWSRGWHTCISGNAPSGRSTQRFNFDLTAPNTPGTYYIGVFTGWMYSCDEVASNDHPPQYGDGDDVWDMPQQGWEQVITNGQASTGSYRQQGRAIRIVVEQSGQPRLELEHNFPRSVTLGSTFSVTVSVRNVGNGDATNVLSGIGWSPDDAFSGQGCSGTWGAERLRPGERIQYTCRIRAERVGTHTAWVGANADGGVSMEDRFQVTVQQQDTIPPTVRVLAPNGGETLAVGQIFRIRWEASDNVGISRIHIWLFQGGSQVAVIAANQPNTGYYDWTVLDRPGAGYKIRIAAVDAAGNVGYDDSDGTFQIQQQPQPQAGSLTIRIHNVKGLTMLQSGGSLDVSLYKWDSSRNQWMFVSSGAVPYRGGVEYVVTSFSNLELNKYYYLEVRHTPASWLRLVEYWGWFMFTLTSKNSSASIDFYRSRPYITNVNYPDSVASGGSITFSIPVKNEDTQSRAIYLTVILDRDLTPPYDVIQNSSAFTLAPGETRAITVTLTALEPGRYNPYIVLSLYQPSDPNIHKTVYDQWDGSSRPIEITAQPACNLEVVSISLYDEKSGRPLDGRVLVGQDFGIGVLVRNSGSSSVCISRSGLGVEWSPRDMLKIHWLYLGIPPEEIRPGQEVGVSLGGWLTALKPGVVTIKITAGGCIGHSEREGEVCNCAEDFGPMCEATKYIILEIVPGEVTTVTITSTVTKTETIYTEETTYKTYHTWTTVTRTLWTRTTEYVTTTTTSTATTWTTTTITTTVTSSMGPGSALSLAFLAAPIASLIVKVRRRWRR